MNGDRSRTLDLAARVTRQGTDPTTALEARSVAVSADTNYPGAVATARVLVTNLRKLPVTLRLVTGQGPTALPDQFIVELVAAAVALDPDRGLQVVDRAAAGDLTVHVGPDLKADMTVVPDGHGARLHRQTPLPALFGGTGLGAVTAAAVATAEIFKVLLDLPEATHPRQHSLAYDPVTLSTPAEPIPVHDIPAETALIGGGAVGTAIAVIFGALGISGELTVIDPETFDDPNVYTYSLGTLADAAAETHKTDLIKAALPNLDVTPVRGTVLDWISQLGENPGSRWPRTVLSGVDSVEARHQIARLHADRTFDASTGGPTGTMLSLAETRYDGPCLRCHYPVLPSPSATSEQLLAEQTGLPLERIARGDNLIDTDLTQLTPEWRRRLATELNKPICGLARSLGIGLAPTFRPSAVFVAQQAAVLAIGALLLELHRGNQPRPNSLRHIQYDALLGLRDGHTVGRRAAGACVCQRDAALIRQIRSTRQ